MSEHVNVRQLSHATQLAQEWINDLVERAGFENTEQAYSHLRAVLHAVRDRLTVEEAAHLGSQLPMMVRGFYFEGWRPSMAPNDFRTPEEFYAHVRESLADAPPAQDRSIEETTRSVLELLNDRVDAGQMRHVVTQMPEPIARLFPEPARA